MKNLKISSLFLLILVLGTTSCVGKKKEKEELEVKKTEIAEVVSNYVYPLPSSFELMDMLNEIEAAFIIGISNPAEDVSKYKTEAKQALNLGVYLTDLSYASVYHRKQSAQDYLSSCEKIVRSLHVDDSFQQDFLTEVSENIDNRETLVDLLTNATQNIYGDLHRKGHTDLASLMVAGAWTEAMYLTLIISENTPLNAQIINTIIFQHKSLIETIALLEKSKEVAMVSPILTALKGIQNIFSQEDPNSLSMEQITKLQAQTNALRAQIIE